MQSLSLSLMKTSIRLSPLSNKLCTPRDGPSCSATMYQLYRTRHELVLLGTQAETGTC